MYRNIRKTKIRELSLQCLNKLLADVVLQIKLLILRPLIIASVTPNRRHVDHAVPELHECTSHDWQIQLCNILQAELGELLVLFFPEPSDEGGRGEGFTETESTEAVFGEAEVEEGGYVYGIAAELFLLFFEVGAANVANGDFLAEGGEEGEHFGGGWLNEMLVGILKLNLCP
jgi:hypothetical protein